MRLLLLWFVLAACGCHAQSLDSLRRAAAAGSAPACMRLYEIYLNGEQGQKAHADSSWKYLQRAANANSADAQYLLAIALLRGVQGKKDELKAQTWLQRAAEQRNTAALDMLTEYYSNPAASFGQARKLTSADARKAYDYAHTSAGLGSAKGAWYMGKALHEGLGVARNDTLAVIWMTFAAVYGNFPEAQITLGHWYYSGQTTLGGDLERARHYYYMAYKNRMSSLEEVTEGKIGLHYTNQLERQILNLHTLMAVPAVTEAPQWRVGQ